MKALVYQGPGKILLEERPMPTISAPTDAIVRITKTTICGTDLHILKGDVPSCTPGRVLGHEGVGIVEEAGAGVIRFKKEIMSLSPVSLPAVNANIAGRACIPIA